MASKADSIILYDVLPTYVSSRLDGSGVGIDSKWNPARALEVRGYRILGNMRIWIWWLVSGIENTHMKILLNSD